MLKRKNLRDALGTILHMGSCAECRKQFLSGSEAIYYAPGKYSHLYYCAVCAKKKENNDG